MPTEPQSAAASAVVAAVLALVVGLITAPEPAPAVPSFALQTGQPCAVCHTAYPELTAFGCRLELSGYTLESGDLKGPPVEAMIMPSFTHIEAKQDSPPALA